MKRILCILFLAVLLFTGCTVVREKAAGTEGGSVELAVPAGPEEEKESLPESEAEAEPEPEPAPEPEPTSATVLGKEYPLDTAFLDLPSDKVRSPEDLKGMEELKQLAEVDLTGSVRSREEMDALMQAFPGVTFYFRSELYGVEVTGYDEEVDLSGILIDDFAELTRHFRYLPRLKKLVLCDCGRTDRELAAFRSVADGVKIVWRLYLHGGFYSLRTDDIAFSTLYTGEDPSVKMYDDEVQCLRYCTDLQALDLGHMHLRDISFLEDLPELRVLILADNNILDISPIGKLEKLTYLELFMNYSVSTLEPLSHLENLRDLNISYLWAPRDYEYLYGLTNLERLWINQCRVTPSERQGLEENIVSTCELHIAENESSTGGGWRDESEKHWAQYNMFRGNYIDDIFQP